MRKLIGRLIFGIVLLAAFCNANAATDNPNTACLLSAKKDVEDSLATFKDSKQWPAVLSCIETGDSDWVRFANAFARDVDHGYKRDQVVFALGVALGNNAHDVLEITQYEFSLGLTLNDICIAPDGGDSRFGSYDLLMGEIRKRERAIAGIKDNELKKDAKTCSDWLERAKQSAALVFRSPDKCTLSSASIANQIRRTGAHPTYVALTRSESTWEPVITCIGTGDPKWIRIDSSLQPVSDGHYGEELNTALGVAFGNRPKDVLEIGGSLDVICSAPDIDDPSYGTYTLAIKEIARRESLLDTITEKELASDVAECRNDFESAKKWMAHVFGIETGNYP